MEYIYTYGILDMYKHGGAKLIWYEEQMWQKIANELNRYETKKVSRNQNCSIQSKLNLGGVIRLIAEFRWSL